MKGQIMKEKTAKRVGFLVSVVGVFLSWLGGYLRDRKNRSPRNSVRDSRD